MPLSSRMSLTPQKLWLGTSKQGSATQPPNAMLTPEHAWTHTPSCTPDYLAEAVRAKRADLRRSASNGHVAGTSVYREKEDMYDEIIELKKSLHMQKSDVDLMRTKLRRLEEENSRKDRQIEQLLDPGRGPDFVRTLAEKKPDTGWVITGLKQRIFRLEQQCKEKDNTINKLQTDMKTTNLEEMRIAMETYYEEIHRLQTLLASSEVTGKKPPVEKKLGAKRQKKMSNALLNLTRSVQELTEENQSLKEDLDRMLSNSPSGSKIKGYMDWSKPRLLRRITELEKRISSTDSPKPSTSEMVKLNPLVSSSSSNVSAHKQSKGDQPRGDQPKGDHSEEQERLRGIIKNLKGERSTLRMQLQEKEEEVRQLLQAKVSVEKELERARKGENERQEAEQALKEEIGRLTNRCQELEEAQRQEKESSSEVTPEAPVAVLHMPSPCSQDFPSQSASEQDSRSSGSEEDSSRPLTPCSNQRREDAARILQVQWKAHRCKKRRAALDEAATVLQAAFRGHLARSKLLSSKAPVSRSPSLPDFPEQSQSSSSTSCTPSPNAQVEDSPAQEEIIIIIQSVLRGHLARAKFSAITEGTVATLAQSTAITAARPESTSPPFLTASLEALRVGLFAKEEPRGIAVVESVASPHLCVSAFTPGGQQGCPSPSGLEAVPCSGRKDACEESDGEEGSAWPSLEPSPPGLQSISPPSIEDLSSDDSDDIVIPPPVPRKKSPSPF